MVKGKLKHLLARALPWTLLAAGAACPGANFSQRAGFDAWRQQAHRDARVASSRERELLQRHRPRFLLPRGHPGPIDFYRDYVSNGVLRDGQGVAVQGPPDRRRLNALADDPEAVLEHHPPEQATVPAVVYGRADRVRVDAANGVHRLTVLTWNAVFRRSGLPAGLSGAPELLAELAGAAEDWHQLDNYTAASLVLDTSGRPVALMLQQHNYTRTWLFGETLDLPGDGRPRVEVAERSNELFPYADGERLRPAVRYADAEGMRYLMGFGPAPMMAAPDVTRGDREADYSLEFLRTDDAFYLFQGYLGERRMLPGRDGPPGAGYNTVPELKPLDLQLFAGYWREGSVDDLDRFERLAVAGGSRRAFAEAQREVFFQNLACLRRLRRACR